MSTTKIEGKDFYKSTDEFDGITITRLRMDLLEEHPHDEALKKGTPFLFGPKGLMSLPLDLNYRVKAGDHIQFKMTTSDRRDNATKNSKVKKTPLRRVPVKNVPVAAVRVRDEETDAVPDDPPAEKKNRHKGRSFKKGAKKLSPADDPNYEWSSGLQAYMRQAPKNRKFSRDIAVDENGRIMWKYDVKKGNWVSVASKNIRTAAERNRIDTMLRTKEERKKIKEIPSGVSAWAADYRHGQKRPATAGNNYHYRFCALHVGLFKEPGGWADHRGCARMGVKPTSPELELKRTGVLEPKTKASSKKKPKRISRVRHICSVHGTFTGFAWNGHRRLCKAPEAGSLRPSKAKRTPVRTPVKVDVIRKITERIENAEEAVEAAKLAFFGLSEKEQSLKKELEAKSKEVSEARTAYQKAANDLTELVKSINSTLD